MKSNPSIPSRSPAMKQLCYLSTIALALLSASLVLAQAPPATKPDNATGQCKDGSYSTAASKSGACRGHNGVKEWYTAATTPKATPATPTAPVATVPSTANAVATTPSPSTQVKTQTQAAAQAASQSDTPPATTSIQKPATTSSTPAAGGGPGMVWVNASSNVYHCPGTKFYGKTKSGSYMTEADAKAKGAHADHGNACTK